MPRAPLEGSSSPYEEVAKANQGKSKVMGRILWARFNLDRCS